jgi:hypothetical protein
MFRKAYGAVSCHLCTIYLTFLALHFCTGLVWPCDAILPALCFKGQYIVLFVYIRSRGD